MSVTYVIFVSVIKHAVHCFCQELIYAFEYNAGINDGCKITKKTSAVCVCVRARAVGVTFPLMCYTKL